MYMKNDFFSEVVLLTISIITCTCSVKHLISQLCSGRLYYSLTNKIKLVIKKYIYYVKCEMHYKIPQSQCHK